MTIVAATEARIRAAQARGRDAVIIFDIDDTLIDCRHRKHRVLQDFIAQTDIRQRYPASCEQLQAVPWQQVLYRVMDTLKLHQIDDEEFGEELLHYWRLHYFTYPYLINDEAFPGALDFVRRCHKLGAVIVYLTGRDEPGMGAGTREGLLRLGFPVAGPKLHFILKADPAQDDGSFKVQALEGIAELGEVIAALENELGNLNAMAERFPAAAMYWRKTLYLPNPPPPHPRVEILLDFPYK